MPYTTVRGRTREEALDAFWRYQEAHTGARRTPPREALEVLKVVRREGGWRVHYAVPWRWRL